MKNSSVIRKYAYTKEHQTLFVRFTSGKEYNFFGVPPVAFEKLAKAENQGKSLGRVFNQHIKDRYDYQEL